MEIKWASPAIHFILDKLFPINKPTSFFRSSGGGASTTCLSPELWLSMLITKSSQNYRMLWLGRDLTDHLFPTPYHGQGHSPK